MWRHALLASALASGTIAVPVAAQDTPGDPPPDQPVRADPRADRAAPREDADAAPGTRASADDDGDLADIIVTGTLIRGPGFRVPIPKVTITAQDLRERGYNDVAQAIQRSSNALGAIQNAQQGFTQGARTVSLFGFGPGFTKYLINGHPVPNYPQLYSGQRVFVDLSAIPTSLVKRIEVLPGGQSSIYGSDAVAGLINIELDDQLDGPRADVRLGLFGRGGGRSLRVTVADGIELGRLSLLGGIQYDDIQPLYSFERDLTRTAFRDGSSPYEPDVVAAVRDDFGDFIALPQGACDPIASLNNGTTALVELNDGAYCANTGYNTATLQNEENRLQVYLHGTFDLSDRAMLYSDLSFNQSTVRYTYALNTQSASRRAFFDPDFGVIRLSRVFAPEEFGSLDKLLSHDDLTSFSGTFGLRGTLDAGWSYDVSALHTRQDLTLNRVALLADPVADYFAGILGPQQGTYDDPFLGALPVFDADISKLFQPVSPGDLAGVYADSVSHGNTRLTWGRALASNNRLFALPAGNVGFAVALEGSDENWRYTPDPLVEEGGYSNLYSDTMGEGSRKFVAIAGELHAPVTSFFSLSGSGRYDRYFYGGSAIGNGSWNIAGELEPLAGVVLRARYGTVFKAPTLAQLFEGESSGLGFGTDFVRCAQLGFDPNGTAACPFGNIFFTAIQGGNPDLRPITADVMDLGATIQPVQGMRISADYLRWTIDNGAIRETPFAILQRELQCQLGQLGADLCAQNDALITRGADGRLISVKAITRNIARDAVEAVTVNASYSHRFDRLGILSIDANWSRLLNREIRNFPGTPEIDVFAQPQYFGGPRVRYNAWLSWERKAVNATVGFEHIGQVPNFLASQFGYEDGFGGARLPGWTTWTLSGGYDFRPGLRLSVAINNLFDADPPIDYSTPGYVSAPYSSGNFDVYGRQFLIDLSVAF